MKGIRIIQRINYGMGITLLICGSLDQNSATVLIGLFALIIGSLGFEGET